MTSSASSMRLIRRNPTSSCRIALQRGAVLLAAAPAFAFPSAPPSALVINHNSSNSNRILQVRRNRAAGMVTMMTAPTNSARAGDNLAQYARTVGGEWSYGPVAALDRIVPSLGDGKHKGQLGRVGVFGGSEDYTGAPFFASVSALRMGADLAFVFTAEQAAPALKAYSPELMVTPVYSSDELTSDGTEAAGVIHTGGGSGSDHSSFARLVVEKLAPRLPKLHSLLLGPGMGRHPAVRKAAAEVVSRARERGLPVVLDADGIAMVVEDPGAVRDFPLAVLTPNANEFRLLCERMERDGGAKCEIHPGGASATEEVRDRAVTVKRLAAYLGGVTVVLKGKVDIISDGTRTVICAVPGGLKRCGGIGDVLSGTMATALAWTLIQKFEGKEAEELRLWAAWWACAVTRHASRKAYEDKGRAMSATSVSDHVGSTVEEIVPSPKIDESRYRDLVSAIPRLNA